MSVDAEATAYLASHGIPDALEQGLHTVLRERPADPLRALADLLDARPRSSPPPPPPSEEPMPMLPITSDATLGFCAGLPLHDGDVFVASFPNDHPTRSAIGCKSSTESLTPPLIARARPPGAFSGKSRRIVSTHRRDE